MVMKQMLLPMLLPMLVASALWATMAQAQGARPEVIDGQEVRVMVIVLDGQSRFTAFVKPNTISRETAIRAMARHAWPWCKRTFDASHVRVIKTKRRSWAVPGEWTISGICE